MLVFSVKCSPLALLISVPLFADPMHTYLGLSALSLNGEEGLQPMYAGLNITKRATSWLRQLHKREDPLA